MEGIMVSIKKRMLNATNTGYDEHSFFVWGFYDVLNINRITRWSQFMQAAPLDKDKIDSITNELEIKLVIPENAKKLVSLPCVDYLQYEPKSKQFSNKPLLSVILINFAKNGIRDFGITEMIYKLTRKLSDEFNTYEIDKKPLFAVYSTIGFMDAAILCRSNGFSSIARAIFKLRVDPSILASSYTLPCLSLSDANAYEDWVNNTDDDCTKLSVRSTLKHHIAFESFQWEFQQELKALGHDANAENTKFSMLFGNYDTLAALNVPASRLHGLYVGNDRLLQPPYKNILTTTKALIQVELEPLKDDPRLKIPKPDAKRAKQQWFVDTIYKYLQKPSSQIVSNNVKTGLINMANFYFDMTNSSHTFDVRAMMDPYLEAIVRCFGLLERNQFHYELTVERFNTSMNIWIDEFTNLVSDFARADRHMFEGRWMKNPSVGSASKLLMTYHFYLNDVIRIFSKKSTYTFLTTSNNVYQMQSNSIFNFFVPDSNTAEEHLFIILRIPEKGLYNISHTLFQIMHESFHFIGNRKRDTRRAFIIASYSLYCAQTFINSFWNKNSNVLNALALHIDEHNRKAFMSVIEDCRKKNVDDLYDYCKIILTDYENHNSSKVPVYLRFWQDVLWDGINVLFSRLYDKIVETYCDILYRALSALSQFENGKKYSHQEMTDALRDILKRRYNEIVDDHMTAISKHFDIVSGIAPSNGTTRAARDTYEIIIECCGEIYPDMCAITILNTSIEGYLATFYSPEFEESLKEPEALRLYCVLKTCFPGEKISVPESKSFENHIEKLIGIAEDFRHITAPLIMYLQKCKTQLEQDIESHNLSNLRRLYKSAQPDSIADIPDIEAEVVNQIINKWSSLA